MMLLQTKDYKTFQLEPEYSDMAPIVFTGHQQANKCLPGDLVNWIDNRCELVRRAKHRFIPGILELNSKYLYGHTSRGAKIYLFHPHDKKYPPFRVGTTTRDTTHNQLGLIEFLDWEDHETMPRGNLIRLLGPCGDLDAEKKALTFQYSYPQLANNVFDIEPFPENQRSSLDGFTLNIDPEGCLDIDDVLTFKQVSDTEWSFVITISDVAAFVKEGSAGNQHASHFGQTLYQQGEAVVPMFPKVLSEKIFSLSPNETHLGISLFCSWNTSTKTLHIEGFKETQFTNNKSFTYESIYKTDEIPLSILQDIASFLKGEETKDSHEWVAEYMILYNKEVAKKLLKYNMGLLRTHKPADAERLAYFTAIHPDCKALAYEAARYEPTGPNQIHAGLGSVPYCHASSPIRRYADLLNQRCLKAILENRILPASDFTIAENLNRIQKRMRQYERSLFFLEKIAEQTSGSVEGVVLSASPEKTKVYIPSWKHSIRVEPGIFAIGEAVQMDYYADLQKPRWDQRMVFRLKSKANASEEHDE